MRLVLRGLQSVEFITSLSPAIYNGYYRVNVDGNICYTILANIKKEMIFFIEKKVVRKCLEIIIIPFFRVPGVGKGFSTN